MIRLYTSHDAVTMGFLKAFLENSGIVCSLRNEHLSGGAGELPLNECWQELWITEDGDFQKAQQMIRSALAEDKTGKDWSCPSCGEEIEAQFGRCWNCGEACP